jgi:transcriptional regulator with XRE-family HTH domain
MQDEKITSGIFSRTFCAVMDAQNINQPRLASEVGLAQSAIYNYRNGRIPKAIELLKLARFFGVTMEFLLTGKQLDPSTRRLPDADEIRREERRRLAGRLKKLVAELEQ